MAEYFVRKSGNDANSGVSKAQAKLTIQAAVNLATSPGDIVHIGAGTYREAVTVAASGTVGNPITYKGDYLGIKTGDPGVVRITGSNDDVTMVRSWGITGSSRSYVTIDGIELDLHASGGIYAVSGAYWTTRNCYFGPQLYGIYVDGAGQTSCVVENCWFLGPTYHVVFTHSADVVAGHQVRGCTFVGGYISANYTRASGGSVRNCTFVGPTFGVYVNALAGGTKVDINNCIFAAMSNCVWASANNGTGVEDFNTFSASLVPRTNIASGANSVTRPMLFDPRPFFEAAVGGRIALPVDHAAYSSLLNYSSGTGAPATDARGSAQIGAAREWGALEYDPNLLTRPLSGVFGSLIEGV